MWHQHRMRWYGSRIDAWQRYLLVVSISIGVSCSSGSQHQNGHEKWQRHENNDGVKRQQAA